MRKLSLSVERGAEIDIHVKHRHVFYGLSPESVPSLKMAMSCSLIMMCAPLVLMTRRAEAGLYPRP
jgi:hypothetical protein